MATTTAAPTANASSNGHYQQQQYYEQPSLPASGYSAFDAPPYAIASATSAGDITLATTATTSETAHMLIARGRLLLETYQRQKAASPEHKDNSLTADTIISGVSNELLQFQSSTGNNNNSHSEGSEHGSVSVRCVETWSDLVVEQQQSAQLLDAIDAQLQRLHACVQQQQQSECATATVLSLCASMHQLLQHKRAAEHAVALFTAAIGPPVMLDDTAGGGGADEPALRSVVSSDQQRRRWLTRPQIRALVEDECAALRRELDDAKRAIEQLTSDARGASVLHDRTGSLTALAARNDSAVDLSTMCADICAPPDDGCHHRVDDFATPLPAGWEMRATESGAVFFVNRHTNVTTWHDPRESIDSLDNDGDGGGRDGHVADMRDAVAMATSSYQQPSPPQQQRIRIPSERKQAFESFENTVTAHVVPGHEHDTDVQYFDVVFKERGPIGIHFQANDPDGGATVRRLLPGTAAVETGILRPFDRLVAVNQHPVDTASFRHVMILLQGGLRPLTLSFKRELSHHSRRITDSSSTRNAAGVDLDEEVVLDAAGDDFVDGAPPGSTSSYIERRRSSRELLIPLRASEFDDGAEQSNRLDNAAAVAAPAATVTRSSSNIPSGVTANASRDDESVADKIITNLFSLFWSPPEPAIAGEVQTV